MDVSVEFRVVQTACTYAAAVTGDAVDVDVGVEVAVEVGVDVGVDEVPPPDEPDPHAADANTVANATATGIRPSLIKTSPL
jgi:hypothetical protein